MTPLPFGEREGPIAQQWEGEGLPPLSPYPLTLPALRASFPLPNWERDI